MILVRDDGFFVPSTFSAECVRVNIDFPDLYLAPLGRYTKEGSHQS